MLIGAAIGALFAWLVRCPGNTCPLTSNWWIPTLFGAIFGLTWNIKGSTSGKKNPKKSDPQEQNDN